MSSAEHLDSHPEPPAAGPQPGRRHTGWVVGGGAAVLAVVGAGAWAAISFLGTGPQPAEALPAATLAYASVDLDPAGGQKIEALRTLREFPALRDRLGLRSTDDLRRAVFEAVQGSGTCPDLDFGRDVQPWLGDRMALAAVDTGAGGPQPVGVLQVSDESAARAGLRAIVDCLTPEFQTDDDNDASEPPEGPARPGFTVADGWALVGPSQEVVDRVAADAAAAPLADDGDYQHWTGAAGDAGIATLYLSPAAGDLLAEQVDVPGLATAPGAPARYSDSAAPVSDFGGLGATLRFDDGSVELEMAADLGDRTEALAAPDHATDMIESLPADTAAAVGLGLADGWFGRVVDQMAAADGTTPERLLAQLSRDTGLDLPADAEALAGDSVALAVGPGFDPADLFHDSRAVPAVPVGLTVHGDPVAIERVLDKVRGRLGSEAGAVGSSTAGDVVAVGPSEAYRGQLLAGGALGDSPVFRAAVPDADRAAAVLFVDFDAGGWLDALVPDDPEAADNLAPLQGLGLAAWRDGGTDHAVLRVTTD